MRLEQTFMHFLLSHQMRNKRTLNFLVLLEAVITAANYIEYYYRTGRLQGNLGETSRINAQHEKVMRMDQIAHQIVARYLRQSRQVIHAVSEEEADVMVIDEDGGRYFFYFDPLDGSSNIKHGLPVGFLFGIAKRNLEGPEDYHLRRGRELIAAGMFVIPSGVFTLALHGAGTWRFQRDETLTYVRPEQVTLPESPETWELSFNSANRRTFATRVQEWIDGNESNYAFRYMGSLAADLHRLLREGGMFMYPAIVNHPCPEKNRPEGKLRLMYECAPAAFMIREAGGLAVDENGIDILDVIPENHHQRTGLYIGCKPVVESIQKVLQENKDASG